MRLKVEFEQFVWFTIGIVFVLAVRMNITHIVMHTPVMGCWAQSEFWTLSYLSQVVNKTHRF